MAETSVTNFSVLFIHRDTAKFAALQSDMKTAGWHTAIYADPDEACFALQREDAGELSSRRMAFIDASYLHRGNGRDGQTHDGLARIRRTAPDVPVVVMADEDMRERATASLQREPSCRPYTYVFGPLTAEGVCGLVTAYFALEPLLKDKAWQHGFIHSQLQVGITIVDRAFRLRYMNDKARRMTHSGVKPCGICYVEHMNDRSLRQPCPWCPVKDTFRDGKTYRRTTTLRVGPKEEFYETTSFAVHDPTGTEVVAAVEQIDQITEKMLRDSQAAVLEGREAFREEMTKMLGRMCDLGFDRARLYIQTRDPQYLDGFAVWGEHDGDIREIRLDQDSDFFYRKTMQFDHHVRYDHDMVPPNWQKLDWPWKIRRKMTGWVEVPLWGHLDRCPQVFVGKLNFDNDLSDDRPVESNERFWPILDEYAAMLGPIIAKARDHWVQEDQAERARALQELDAKLVATEKVNEQFQVIVDCLQETLKPTRCHLRVKREGKLQLTARAGKKTRLRDVVDIHDDRNTSVSARLFEPGTKPQPQFWSVDELNQLVQQGKEAGVSILPEHYDDIKTCGVFPLIADGVKVGTVVVESEHPYFFDAERQAVAEALVRRAQIQIQRTRQAEEAGVKARQVVSLLNTIPSEAAVLGRSGEVRLHNSAWHRRVAGLDRRQAQGSGPHAAACGCAPESERGYQERVNAVFGSKRAESTVARFLRLDNSRLDMDVLIAPFERDPAGDVDSVVVVLSDISAHMALEKISTKTKGLPNDDLQQALQRAAGDVCRIFEATRAMVVECVSLSGEDTEVRIACRVDATGAPVPGPSPEGIISGSGVLAKRLIEEGHLGVEDVRSYDLSEAILGYLSEPGPTVAFLAVPIYLYAEPWGALVVSYREARSVSHRDVELLKAAAVQIGLLATISWQMQIREIDDAIARSVEAGQLGDWRRDAKGVFGRIVRQSLALTGCGGGHMRVVDWHRNQAVLTVAFDPYRANDGTAIREFVSIGDPVAGMVANTGKPYVSNHCRSDPLSDRVLGTIPPDRTDVLKYLEESRSFVCYPLIADDEVLGTFSLTAIHEDHFTKPRLWLLDGFARRAAVALRAAQYIKRMQGMVEKTGRMLDVSSQDELWQKIADFAAELFLARDAVVFSYDRIRDVIVWRAGHDPEIAKAAKGDIGVEGEEPSEDDGCGLPRFVAAKGGTLALTREQTLQHRNLSTTDRKLHELLPDGRLKSVMLARLDLPDGRPVGVLKVENRKGTLGDTGFTAFDKVLMDIFSGTIAVAVERFRLAQSRVQRIGFLRHDLDAPSAAVVSKLSAFLSGKLSLKRDRPDMEDAQRLARRVHGYLKSITDVVDGQDTLLQCWPKSIDPRRLIKEALGIYADKIKEEEWHKEWKVDDSLKEEGIYADPDQLTRVLGNLIGNTLRHGYDTGAEDQARSIEISLVRDRDDLVLCVADRGPGIEEKKRRAILEGRYEPQPEDRKSGHGVGLASVRYIAAAHAGRFSIRDRDDGMTGTVCEFRWCPARLEEKDRRAGQGDSA